MSTNMILILNPSGYSEPLATELLAHKLDPFFCTTQQDCMHILSQGKNAFAGIVFHLSNNSPKNMRFLQKKLKEHQIDLPWVFYKENGVLENGVVGLENLVQVLLGWVKEEMAQTEVEVEMGVVYNDDGVKLICKSYVAQGNFGVVYMFEDEFGQEYVVKVLKTNRPQEEVEADWKKETELLSALNHPAIVRIYDAFVYNNYYYLSMEKARGSIRDLITKRGPLSLSNLKLVASQLLSGLNYIHSKNIIHRDLHIDNILYTYELDPNGNLSLVIKISDFGISKTLQETDLAQTFIGRDYDYAPEMLTLGHTSRLSDIYQVGLILYFCHTGHPAISSNDGNVYTVTPSGLAQTRAYSLHTPLGQVLATALSPSPTDRYQTCLAFHTALTTALQQH